MSTGKTKKIIAFKTKEIIALGYIKKEGGAYTAICVNMGLFGQGQTADEALKNVIEATRSYVEYVLEKHPNDYKRYIDRPAPEEFIREFLLGLENMKKLSKPSKAISRRPRAFIPERNFAEKLSFAQA